MVGNFKTFRTQYAQERHPLGCLFSFGCNEAHLRCMKNEAELCLVKRCFVILKLNMSY